MNLIPVPRECHLENGLLGDIKTFILFPNSEVMDGLCGIISREIMATCKNVNVVIKKGNDNLPIKQGIAGKALEYHLMINDGIDEEGYEISIDDAIYLRGGSYQGVVNGSATVLQLISNEKQNGTSIPRCAIKDTPFASYRGLMVDLARKKHKIKTLFQLVVLCRYYKINRLHLHLSDKQSFTFPSEKHPRLPTKGHHFKRENLLKLVQFAKDRGVIVIPEIDLPGHARSLVKAMPVAFQLKGDVENDGVINMGKERAYEVIDDLVGELRDVFSTSPWVHLGTDEVRHDGIDTDPDCMAYMKQHGIDSSKELYRHFIVRMNEIVKKHGKTMCIWEGFAPEGKIDIPRDILVFEFECYYNLPHDLVKDGYTLVNTSWKPIYITRKYHWTPEEIYRWNMFRWENRSRLSVATEHPIQLDASTPVIGVQMCSWAQVDRVEIQTIRERLAALSERAWSVTRDTATAVPDDKAVNDFLSRLEACDARLTSLLERGRWDKPQ